MSLKALSILRLAGNRQGNQRETVPDLQGNFQETTGKIEGNFTRAVRYDPEVGNITQIVTPRKRLHKYTTLDCYKNGIRIKCFCCGTQLLEANLMICQNCHPFVGDAA